ncbi:MAG: transglutaminase-like domain-containing protein [Clostridiales bacterium]|jgi:transglutaminase-like putative cysteine protease|nr:transglutaminase-like domain-containing protein [Clostridiales bacterium]MDR2752046.1 transglutaminase-like domain-containing protein [Clostridiales bacterium]
MRFFAALIAAIAILAAAQTVYADVSIDASASDKGLVQIQYKGDLTKSVKVLVEANGDKNVYQIREEGSNNVPLQMGKGEYKITVLQNVAGNKYKPLATQSVTVDKVDQQSMFSSQSYLVTFNDAMKSISAYSKLLAEKKATDDKITAVYNDLVKNYSYDFAKVKTLPTDYVPWIDDMYGTKMGICYDYAALLAGVLRSQGIPTKLVMGYAPNVKEYHAWNEILMDDKWVVVDTTYDSQLDKAKVAYTFAKDGAKRKVVKVY